MPRTRVESAITAKTNARAFTKALGALTERRPNQWRMIASVAQRLVVEWPAAEKAALQAEAKGWLIVEAGHSVCLTEAGRKL